MEVVKRQFRKWIYLFHILNNFTIFKTIQEYHIGKIYIIN